MARNNFPIVCRQENHWHLTDENYQNDALLKSEDEYKKYWRKIERGENFALARYADGELSLMLGKEVHAHEGWQAGNEVTLLGKALKDSLGFANPNFVYAISCPCCDSEAYYWYLSRLNNCNITFANLWINANFARFRQDFLNLERDAVLITNYRGKGKTYGKLNVRRYYTISDDCVKFWAAEADNLIRQIIDETGHEKNLLYVVSAGPMSGLIIKALFEKNPDNTYVDFGSSIDFITHDKVTRPYMIETTPYAKQKCWMFDNLKMSTKIDVVLSAYRRPEVLQHQIDAIREQTLKPARILLYQDAVAVGTKVVLSEEILSQFDEYCVAEENGGVWKRFEYAAKKATAPYVCIFDDDTIPGRRWLENCHMHSVQNGGVYGTNGIILKYFDSYPQYSVHIGWHGPSNDALEVDFVGHSWFARREYLEWMTAKPYGQEFKYVGEDMALSFACQEHGVQTFVPPHPTQILALWGSIPQYGNQYGGGADTAVSMNQNNLIAMKKALIKMHSDGWELLFEREPYYVEHFLNQNPRGRIEASLRTNVTLLRLMSKKRTIFMGERKYAAAARNLFALVPEDYYVLENGEGKILAERLFGGFRRYALHVFFTDVYAQLKPYLQQQKLVEGEDFIDGRSILNLI